MLGTHIDQRFTQYNMTYVMCLDLASSLILSNRHNLNENNLHGNRNVSHRAHGKASPHFYLLKQSGFYALRCAGFLEATTHLTLRPPHLAVSTPTVRLTNTFIVATCMWKVFTTTRH